MTLSWPGCRILEELTSVLVSVSLWQGTLRMVAIHSRALNEEQIEQNYSVGVGEKFFLLFSISDVIGVPGAFSPKASSRDCRPVSEAPGLWEPRET